MQAQITEKIQQTFRDDAMGKIQIKEWYNWFKDGRTSVDSEPHCNRPLTSRNNEMITEFQGKVYEDH